jgi:hypothetical protein
MLKLPFEVFVFGEPDIVQRTIAGIRVSGL